ncbi:MAG: hypothetical protein JWM76_3411 [Pseudonocardiales bacterium]|nr:hypothetical protein [Pseudonocardiales bacterium]
MDRPELELADWRRQVSVLYADVRAEADPEEGHRIWRAGRDHLFRTHPQSPLPAADPLRESGLPYWPYDAGLRFELELRPAPEQRLPLPTGDGTTELVLVGRIELPAPFAAPIDVWWLDQYAGGLFVPVRDGSAGAASYGGGRYLLDSAKSADLGGSTGRLIIDLNFLYHPSCRYDSAWVCPLAPPGNTISAPIEAGEQMTPF